MSAAKFLNYGVAAMALHVIAYMLVCRPKLRTETAILAFHVFLALALFVFAVIFVVLSIDEERWAAAVALVSVNGIYSLTFLELWTLSQISYSRELLVRAKNGKLRSASSNADELVRLGNEKRSARLLSLRSMGLLASTEHGWKLGRRGKLVAAVLQLLLWLPNLRLRG